MAIFQHGMDRLHQRYPYHREVLSRMRILPSNRTRTMCVGWEDGQVTLRWSRNFVENLTADEVCGVLCHEVNHVIGRHIDMRPPEYADAHALLVATEVTANEYIRELDLLPRITLDQYPELPPDESAHERYERLPKKKPASQLRPTQTPGESPAQAGALDDHSTWEEFRKADQDEVDAAVTALLSDSWDALSEAEKTKVAGTLPGSLNRLLIEQKGRKDWRAVLRARLGRKIREVSVMNYPNRRLPDLCGVVPSRRRIPDKLRILAAIDTSGSMSEEVLSGIAAEVMKMRRDFEILVVEADAEIRRVRNAEEIYSITEAAGGGGTDFRPALAPEFLRENQIDVVVYFTDGFGPAPEKRPFVPVIWCLTEDGEKPVPWGECIRLENRVH